MVTLTITFTLAASPDALQDLGLSGLWLLAAGFVIIDDGRRRKRRKARAHAALLPPRPAGAKFF